MTKLHEIAEEFLAALNQDVAITFRPLIYRDGSASYTLKKDGTLWCMDAATGDECDVTTSSLLLLEVLENLQAIHNGFRVAAAIAQVQQEARDRHAERVRKAMDAAEDWLKLRRGRK